MCKHRQHEIPNTTKQAVTFSQRVQVKAIPHNTKYARSQRQTLWYTKDELKFIKRMCNVEQQQDMYDQQYGCLEVKHPQQQQSPEEEHAATKWKNLNRVSYNYNGTAINSIQPTQMSSVTMMREVQCY